ncbi:MAG: HNH endonuclease [Planctomycetaceae bacterium]|nr:HNH endonuclease [Planctomycetaceae bacterium]
MATALERAVWQRAGSACEYCHLAQIFDPLPFQLDHVIARQHGGQTTEENLALSCLFCNKHKGPNIAGIDPQSRRLVRLFHPRRDKWSRHFQWSGAILVGRTAIGRATIEVLAINHPQNVALRRALIENGEVFGE